MMSEENQKVPPHKVGDVIEDGGVRKAVMGVYETKGGGWIVKTSAEPSAKGKGYVRLDDACGFKIEHLPPSFVERGTPRNPSCMRKADWDFRELLSRPDEEKRLALFHELARESSRMREACRIYLAGKDEADSWERKKAEAMQRAFVAQEDFKAIDKSLKALKEDLSRSRKRANKSQQKKIHALEKAHDLKWKSANEADCDASQIAMQACLGGARQIWKDAENFLTKRLNSFPYGVRNLLLDAIAKDVPWSKVSEADKTELLSVVKRDAQEGLKHRSLTFNDLPGGGLDWPFDAPIQFAYDPNERRECGQPSYYFNDGVPRRLCVASKSNGKDGQRILSESLELCVCLNYRDEEILEAFQAWLDWRRKGLHDDLAEFKVSSKRAYMKLKGNNVDAALKGLAALRLMAALPRKEAAGKFDSIFFPGAKQRKPDAGNLAHQADIAKQWQQRFFHYCPLDSAMPVNPGKVLYDRECPMCYNLEKIEQEPSHELLDWPHSFRCKVCDHRASMRWNGQEWQWMPRG